MDPTPKTWPNEIKPSIGAICSIIIGRDYIYIWGKMTYSSYSPRIFKRQESKKERKKETWPFGLEEKKKKKRVLNLFFISKQSLEEFLVR